MSSQAQPATLEARLRAIRMRRRASQTEEVLKLSAWFLGIGAAASMAAATLIGSR